MKHWTLELAEYFFGDFTRWLGLVILVAVGGFRWSTCILDSGRSTLSFEG